MRCVYEAANNVEAHMVSNMLEQHNIPARVDGEYLTSGMGELPAAGLVRVMADESNYERAREIIREWETKSPVEAAPPATRKSRGALWFFAGVVVTIAITSWVNRSMVSTDGIDFNADGKLDERYFYTGQLLSRIEQDRNFDQKIDANYKYDSHGWLYLLELDDDFNGSVETRTFFENGNQKHGETDVDGDHSVDVRHEYVYGVLATSTYLAAGNTVRKREYFVNGLLNRDELDSDNDGTMDTFRKYDRFAEIIETTRK